MRRNDDSAANAGPANQYDDALDLPDLPPAKSERSQDGGRSWNKMLKYTTLLFLLPIIASPASAGDRPNIVFILADDLGWTDLGVQGSKYYDSPNIDRLALQGMRLTSYHNCPNCTPTRAALISGQYGARTGMYTVGNIDRFAW